MSAIAAAIISGIFALGGAGMSAAGAASNNKASAEESERLNALSHDSWKQEFGLEKDKNFMNNIATYLAQDSNLKDRLAKAWGRRMR